ncbi:MAG: hypothetical protein QXJ27_07440, partial [Thermoplasmata archaeon]
MARIDMRVEDISPYIPSKVKKAIKYLLYTMKGIKIKSAQYNILKNYDRKIKKAIIFLVPGYDTVNGGILSIA